MSNMSYVRYENTYKALEECLNALKNEGDYDISDSEKEFREDLKTLCQDFIRTFNKMVKNEKI